MEDVEMDVSPTDFEARDFTRREKFRRYGKSPLASSHHDGSATRLSEIRSNAALFLEDVKQEVESFDMDHGGTPYRTHISPRRRLRAASVGQSELDFGEELGHRSSGVRALKYLKQEEDEITDSRDNTFSLFASLLDSALQGLMPFQDLILRFESACRDVSESIRSGSNERHRIVADKLMRQKAKLLLDEAASWSLLWYIFGKGNEEIPEELVMLPKTSHLEACQFVTENHTAQLCLRIVQWLEGLASKALDLNDKVRGSHAGTYLSKSGIWHNTQRYLQKGVSNPKMVHHLDFDAPTREHAQHLPDDKKQDESFLEDVWSLLRAGRLDDACSLCRSSGQPWRAASLCPFGGYDLFPSIEKLVKNGKNRILQAIELESGIGHQFRLWKWASYCASEQIAEQDGGKYETAVYASRCSNLKHMLPICKDWESACWAMAKSWLDVLVDMDLATSQPGGVDQFKSYEEALERTPELGEGGSHQTAGPDNWPLQVLNQQPRNLGALLQKLHSSDTVHEAVTRACKEQQRQIQMSIMVGGIPHLLELIWSWISPSEDHQNDFKFGQPIKVNWAYASGQREDTTGHFNIFVGDLSPEVTDAVLFACFSVYSSCSDARVMWDQKTGRSRGYGFVSFRNQQEAQSAINDLTGKWLGSRQIRCNWAAKGAGANDDKNFDAKSVVELTTGTSEDGKEVVANNDAPENNPQYTTVYVGNLAPEVTQLELHRHFHALGVGVIEEVRVQRDKGFGFVRYNTHAEAAMAIQIGNTQSNLYGKQIKCSWGNKPTPLGTSSNPLPPPAPAVLPGLSANDLIAYERQLAMSKMGSMHALMHTQGQLPMKQPSIGMGAPGASQAIYDGGFQNVATAQQLMYYQ